MTGVPLLATTSFFMDGGDGEVGIAKGESILIGWYDGAVTDRNLRETEVTMIEGKLGMVKLA